jgi:hypothetical protein
MMTNIHDFSGVKIYDPGIQAAKARALDRTATDIGLIYFCRPRYIRTRRITE